MPQVRPAHLRLYVAGASPQSTRAVRSLRRWCDGTISFEVIDVYRHPALAADHGVTAVPCVENPENGRVVVLRGGIPADDLDGRLRLGERE